mgnify:FL=1
MNYLDLINIKYSFKIELFILVITFIIIIGYVLNLDIYECYQTYGYIEDELIKVKISIEDPDVLTNLKYIKIGSDNYDAEINEISEVLIDKDNFINYQMVKLKIDEGLNNNEVFKIGIFYNEEKVYKKLKKALF